MSETTTAPMPQGAMAELTRDARNLTSDKRLHRKGDRVLIEYYVDEQESEDGVPFYWASDDRGTNNVCLPPDALAQVMTPQQVNARQLPTREEMLRFLGTTTLDRRHGLDVEETDVELAEDGTVSLLGTTADGLPFHAIISVVRVEHWDR